MNPFGKSRRDFLCLFIQYSVFSDQSQWSVAVISGSFQKEWSVFSLSIQPQCSVNLMS